MCFCVCVCVCVCVFVCVCLNLNNGGFTATLVNSQTVALLYCMFVLAHDVMLVFIHTMLATQLVQATHSFSKNRSEAVLVTVTTAYNGCFGKVLLSLLRKDYRKPYEFIQDCHFKRAVLRNGQVNGHFKASGTSKIYT